MLNKFYKSIHNKYSTLFKFIFFLRYLFGIFFIFGILFLFIPYFLDFKKQGEIIKNHLSDSYDFKLIKYENIKYNALPIPSLEIQNADLVLKSDLIKISVKNFKIYPKLINFYNYRDFKTNKIFFNNSKIILDETNLKSLIHSIYNLKRRLVVKNLDIQLNKKDSFLIRLKKINFSNYGYNKNVVRGVLFDKNFKISISDNYKKINFKLFKTGIIADIILNEIKEDSVVSGIFKSKLLNSNLKFNFNYDDKKLRIYNSYFRSKDLSFNNESIITHQPFFNLIAIFKVEDINIKLLKAININKIINSKDLIKNINTKSEINFKSKKLSSNLIDELNLNINLAYGKLVYSKTFLISDNFFKCFGDVNLLKEYPILYFNCSISSNDKKKFLKEFSIKYKNKNEIFKLNAEGNINILNNKINFKNIKMSDYQASKEDMIYFKQSFETIIFNKDFSSIFDIEKIKKFILEIS